MFTEFCTCDNSKFKPSGCICGSQEKNITLGMLKMLMIECAKNWQDLRSPIVNRRIHPEVKDEMLYQALLTAFHLTMMETGMDSGEVNEKLAFARIAV